MSSGPALPNGLHFVADSPVPGLALAERRVANPLATVICIHGGLDRGGSFARLARRTEAFDVVAYDRRGYQGSRGLQPLSLEHHVDDLLAIARREGERGPVVYFGHSFGGVVSFAAAIQEPSSTQLVVNYESPLPWILPRELSRPQLGDDPEYEAEIFFRRMVSNAAWERLSEHERQSRRMDGPALFSDLALLRSGAVPFDMAGLKTPALYAHGDWVVADYYRRLCELLPTINQLIRTREIQNARHGARGVLQCRIRWQLKASIKSF